MLKIAGVSKKIGQNEILKDISFTVDAHEIVGLVGPNGAGKSTLMKLIAGYNFPSGGNITINDFDVEKDRCSAIACSAFLVEEPALYLHLSGQAHIDMLKKGRDVTDAGYESGMEFIDFEKQLKDPTRTYSVGMKQRLALAMCWMVEPKLLVLDEPLNGLDPDSIFLIREKLKKITEEGCAVLISSHLLGELDTVADRYVFLSKGRLAGEAKAGDETLEELYRRIFSVERSAK